MMRSDKGKTNGTWLIVLCVCLAISVVSAFAESPDIQKYLPLFERNSLGGKILDLRYRVGGKATGHIIFDAGTGNFREETPFQTRQDVTLLFVCMWDGKEFVKLTSAISDVSETHSSKEIPFELPRTAVISDALYRCPSLLSFCCDALGRPISKTVLDDDPKLVAVSGDTITIEGKTRKFEFSKKTSALKRIEDYYFSNSNQRTLYQSYDFSDHVECSGVLIPLRIVNNYIPCNGPQLKNEWCIDPKTLHLLDKVDVNLFHEPLPVGCRVTDQIRKTEYTVTTPDTTLPQDVKSVQMILDAMIDQAEKQMTANEGDQEQKQRQEHEEKK